MSKPKSNKSLLGMDRSNLVRNDMNQFSKVQLEDMMFEILENKIHGISFSPYLEGQDPGEYSYITDEQIKERLSIVKPHTNWIRTFSCLLGNENVPKIAHEMGLKTMVGAWIGDNLDLNEAEISSAIALANQGHVDILAVGNEVLLRDDISLEQLISYIKKAKEEAPNVKIGYVDAYYVFAEYPEIVELCDVLLINCYPFWEKAHVDVSVDYMKRMYNMVKEIAGDAEVIISETGWPTKGESYGAAEPSYENSMKYFVQTQEWVLRNNIPTFYFSSFDEAWKVDHEGEYGAYWGIWDKDGNYKFHK